MKFGRRVRATINTKQRGQATRRQKLGLHPASVAATLQLRRAMGEPQGMSYAELMEGITVTQALLQNVQAVLTDLAPVDTAETGAALDQQCLVYKLTSLITKGGVLRTALQEAPPPPQNFWPRRISSFGDEHWRELVCFASDGTGLTNASSHGQKSLRSSCFHSGLLTASPGVRVTGQQLGSTRFVVGTSHVL